MYRIRCRNITKAFTRHTGQMLARQYLMSWWNRKSAHSVERFYALRDVSFDVPEGQSLAVVGTNGAGKSTLLSVITGLAYPEEGTVEINGRVAALLELGSGFHPDLTGRENVRLNAALLGFTERQTNEAFESIVEFAGIGDFMDEPLRTYSSGMTMRLAFSVAVNVDPEILIIDEVLAVGDHAFQAKCFERILAMRRAGKTLVCVSHGAQMLMELCDHALWLDHGQVVMQGDIREVLAAYEHGTPVKAPVPGT